MSCRVYCACSMTGRDAKDIVAVERAAAMALRSYGLTPLDPAKKEGVKPTDGVIVPKEDLLRRYWADDKEMIRSAHVILDLTAPMKSAGVEQEIGYGRWFLWMPVVRVWPNLGPSIARLEGDVIAETVRDAAREIKAHWGTPWKRLKWRAKLYVRCRLKAFYYELKEWINAIY